MFVMKKILLGNIIISIPILLPLLVGNIIFNKCLYSSGIIRTPRN